MIKLFDVLVVSYRNRFGGGLILYINENISCKPLQEHIHLPNFEVLATEFYQNNQNNQVYNLTSLIKEVTSFWSSNPSCIDLILIDQKNGYKLSNTFETEISDHHKLISTVTKSGSFNGWSREKIYRSYRSFNIETFKKMLSGKLSRLESNSYSKFEKVFLNSTK